MKTILLINPLSRDFMPPSMPPVGLAYIAAVLRKLSHQVKIVDLDVHRDDSTSYLKNVLLQQSYDLIGITSIITQYDQVRRLGKVVKELVSEIPLIFGGPGPTSIPYLYLENCFADAVLVGEGEETIVEIVDHLVAGSDWRKCKGIQFLKDGQVVNMGERAPIKDIDGIPFPAWDLFDGMSEYADNFLFRSGRKRGLSIMTTRGCPGSCNYCMCNFGRKLRMRSTKNIFGEIDMLVEKYQLEHIHFLDDTFVTKGDRIFEICEVFKSRYPNLTWSANVRANLMSLKTLKCMADANCIFLSYGIESGSQPVLDFMKKGFTVEQASNALKWTREAGINHKAYFITGMPVETKETLSETVQFCKDNLVGGEFFFATPLPDTELYEYAVSHGFIKNENVYVSCLGEVRDFLVNMTDFDVEELFQLKFEAEKEICEHLQLHGVKPPRSTRADPLETLKLLPSF